MTIDMAKGIKDLVSIRGIEVEIREKYSGRESYGEETVAIVTDIDLPDLIAEIALAMAYYCERGSKEKVKKGKEIIEFLKDYVEGDNLGLDYVFY